jgi:hypothetical protein
MWMILRRPQFRTKSAGANFKSHLQAARKPGPMDDFRRNRHRMKSVSLPKNLNWKLTKTDWTVKFISLWPSHFFFFKNYNYKLKIFLSAFAVHLQLKSLATFLLEWILEKTENTKPMSQVAVQNHRYEGRKLGFNTNVVTRRYQSSSMFTWFHFPSVKQSPSIRAFRSQVSNVG